MQEVSSLWNEFKKDMIQAVPHLVSALIIIAVGILLAFIAVRITRKALQRKKSDPSLSAFICRAVRIVIYVLTLFSALSAMDISIAGLVAFFSAAVAAIALALQARLSDIASGIVILFTKPFVTGDFIEFGSHKGTVQKIDIMHTSMLTPEGTDVIIPNSVISSSEVNNYTAEPILRVQVDVPIPYDADIEKVKEVLYGVLKHTDKLIRDDTHQDTVVLDRFGDSALDFKVRCYTDFKDYWNVYFQLTESIKKALDESEIAIPFNQLDVHINP